MIMRVLIPSRALAMAYAIVLMFTVSFSVFSQGIEVTNQVKSMSLSSVGAEPVAQTAAPTAPTAPTAPAATPAAPVTVVNGHVYHSNPNSIATAPPSSTPVAIPAPPGSEPSAIPPHIASVLTSPTYQPTLHPQHQPTVYDPVEVANLTEAVNNATRLVYNETHAPHSIVLSNNYVWYEKIPKDEGDFESFENVKNRTFVKVYNRTQLYTLGADVSPITDDNLTQAEYRMKVAYVSALTRGLPLKNKNASEDPHNLCGTAPSRNHQNFQSLIRDQQTRELSAVFATLAGLEAAYMRRYREAYDLSEQYLNYISRSSVFQPNKTGFSFENECSLWDGGNSLDAVRALKTYGTVRERDVPYFTEAEMIKAAKKSKVPNVLVRSSKTSQSDIDNFEYGRHYIPFDAPVNMRFGVSKYVALTSVETRNFCIMERILQKSEVIVDFDLRWSPSEVGIMVYNSSAPSGRHSMLIVGYDRVGGYFWAKNSWGSTSYVRVSYLVMQRASLGGVVILKPLFAHGSESYSRSLKASFLGRWFMNVNGNPPSILVIRRIKPAVVGSLYLHILGNMVEHPVKGIFSKEGHELTIQVKNNTYQLFMHAAKRTLVSGVRISGAKRVGIILSRNPIERTNRPLVHSSAGVFLSDFSHEEFVGTWNLFVNGNKWKLEFGPFIGNLFENGTRRPIRARVSDHNQIVRAAQADILYGPNYGQRGRVVLLKVHVGKYGPSEWQLIWIYYHTRERFVFSGYTIDNADGLVKPIAGFRHHDRNAAAKAQLKIVKQALQKT